MLKRLTVRNLALAENLAVDFEPGLNAVTGETGAGKSIFIGALALLLGERADKTLIRTGADACSAEAVFDVSACPPVQALLADQGLPPCEDGLMVVRRIVRTTGGQNWVNDAAVTLQTLRRLGEELVDMHGPHDHQSLFDPNAQLDILDAFGAAAALRAAYAASHARVVDLCARRRAIAEAGASDPAGGIEHLEEQVREIEAADLKEGEEADIEAEHRRAGNAQRILELITGILSGLTEDEESAFNRMTALQRPLEELERLAPEAEAWRRNLSESILRVQDLSMEISGYAERIEADPDRLAWLDERMAVYRKLKRRYGGDVSSVRAAQEEAVRRLDDLRNRDARLAEVDRETAEAEKAREAAGLRLRAQRRKAAQALADAITGELEFLGFPRSAFAVDVQPCPPRETGMDTAEFGFAPNVGEAMRPLRAIASSGEVSRVMLATKAVLAEHDRVPVLVFDEIDANLGGELGHAVGRELRGVAQRRQVICITHLPQVAVYGHTHFAVTKDVRGGRTLSRIDRLDAEDRVAEVARMLGGAERETAMAHAAALLALGGEDPS